MVYRYRAGRPLIPYLPQDPGGLYDRGVQTLSLYRDLNRTRSPASASRANPAIATTWDLIFACCEAAFRLAERLGAGPNVAAALAEAYGRWDGKVFPLPRVKVSLSDLATHAASGLSRSMSQQGDRIEGHETRITMGGRTANNPSADRDPVTSVEAG